MFPHIFIIIAGPIVAYVSSLVLYTIGDIADSLYQIKENSYIAIRKTKKAEDATLRQQQLNKLLESGEITKEEYEALSKK